MSLDIIVWFLAAAAVFSFVERKFLKHEANDWWKSIECHKVENTYLIFMRVFALNLLKNDDHAVHWNRWIHSIAKWHDTERHFFSIQLYRWIIPFSFCSLIIFIVKTKISVCSTHTHINVNITSMPSTSISSLPSKIQWFRNIFEEGKIYIRLL